MKVYPEGHEAHEVPILGTALSFVSLVNFVVNGIREAHGSSSYAGSDMNSAKSSLFTMRMKSSVAAGKWPPS